MSVSVVEFGRQVARALGGATSAARLAKQEAAVVEFAARQRRMQTRSLPWRSMMLGAVGTGALGVGLYLQVHSFRASEQPDVHGAVAAHDVDAQGRRSIDLVDGSRLTLEQQAEVQLLDQPDGKARLVSGHINVRVAKQHDRDWVLLAGPYRIAVIGTQFDVSFDAVTEGFEVRVAEGVVRVYGGDLPSEGLSLREGQKYASVPAVAPEAEPSGAPVEPEVAAHPAPSVAKSGATGLIASHRDPSAAPPLPAWRTACAAGRYHEAFPEGRVESTERLPEGELLQLANCLRYAGRNPDATRVLSALRERYPRSPGAVLASYHLARLSERQGQTDAAIRWFETYLAESPKGQLSASARAALIRLWLGRGDSARARGMAKDYLRFHPKGNFASQAQELVERSATPQ